MGKPDVQIKTILFDLDGTIVDTEPAAAEAVRVCCKDWGIQITQEDSSYVTGRTWASACDYFFKRYRFPISQNEALDQLLTAYRESLESQLIVVPGSVEAITALATRFKLGLVSGSNREDIFWILEKLAVLKHFQTVLGAEDYPKSKPAPDGYLKAIDLLKAKPETSLIFEDSHPGVQSARAAGSWVIAITGTNHFQHDTQLAHHHIPDFKSVTPDWIDRVCRNFSQK